MVLPTVPGMELHNMQNEGAEEEEDFTLPHLAGYPPAWDYPHSLGSSCGDGRNGTNSPTAEP